MGWRWKTPEEKAADYDRWVIEEKLKEEIFWKLRLAIGAFPIARLIGWCHSLAYRVVDGKMTLEEAIQEIRRLAGAEIGQRYKGLSC